MPASSRVLVLRPDGALLYPNANEVSDRVLALAGKARPQPETVVLDLSLSPDLDVQSADMLDDLARELARTGVELRLAAVRAPARGVLQRSGLAARVRLAESIDDAIRREL